MGIGTLIDDDAWFCQDCAIAECNGDYSGMDEKRQAEVEAAFAKLAEKGVTCTANFGGEDDEESGEREFSWSPCDCCGSPLGGSRTRFALWKKEESDAEA